MGDFMKNAIIKQESKMFIKGKRVKAMSIVLTSVVYCAVVTAVCFGIILLCELLGGGNILKTAAAIGVLCVLSFAALLFYSSLSVGEKAWYSGITDERKNYTRRLFFWFRPKNSFRALRFKVLLVTIKAMWAVVFFLPFAVLTWSIYYLSGSGGLELYLFISLSGGAILTAVCGAIFYFIAMQKYFIAEYLYSSNPRLKPLTAIRQSKNLLDGHILEIVRFKLSFTPWFLSCIFIAPAFYFLPYYKESCCMVAKKITL